MNEEDTKKRGNSGTDPVQLIIWGILLIGYGIYSVYKALSSEIESHLIFFIMPYSILIVFGTLMVLIGYRNEKNRVKTPTAP